MGNAEAIEKLPFEQYIAIEDEHATGLKDLLVSPRLYMARKERPREDADTLRVGRAAHTAVLEPHRFLLDYALWPDENGKRFGKKWDAFVAMHPNKTILREKQYETARQIADAVRSHKVARKLLNEAGKNELTIRFNYRGVSIKSRIDRLCSALTDLKTTRNPDFRAFGASAARFAYPMQLATYQIAVRELTGEAPPVKLIAAQNCDPFDVVVYDLGEDVLQVGRAQLDTAIDTLLRCQETNNWPGIKPDEEAPLVLPAWAGVSAEDELTFEGEAL